MAEGDKDDDAPAFEAANPHGAAPLLIACDHASNRIPARYAGLGLPPAELARHIAWDIGAAEVTRRLAFRLDAPAVLSGVSRLVIDCNRPFDDASSIPELSDGTAIPGNRGLDAAARQARAERHFLPYHREIERRLDGFAARGIVPVFVSVHSFTPAMGGRERPWHVGLLWDGDDRMARPLIAALRRQAGLVVGDNEPYSGADPRGYAIDVYGHRRGLPMAVFEVRQDLIDTRHGALEWADRLSAALAEVLTVRC